MPEPDKSPSVLNRVFWIVMPLLGMLLVYLLSFVDPRGFLAAAHIDKITLVGYIWFGYLLIYRIVCFVVLDFFLTKLLQRPIPGIVYNSILLLGALVAALVSLDVLFEGAIAYILTLSGVIGVVIGLALRPIILDIFSGISTHLDSAFQIGDWVEVHESVDKVGYSGFVEQINWRTTLIRTKQGNYLICPNSQISTSLISNFSRPNRFSRFEVSLRLPASIETERARRILFKAVEAVESSELGPCPEMKSEVFVSELENAAVYYLVRYWIDRGQHSYRGSRHRILQSIKQHLEMADIPLAEDVILNLDASDVAHRGGAPSLTAIFGNLGLFRGLRAEALASIAGDSRECRYEASDVIIEQGDTDDDMYVILEGGVDVVVQIEGADVVVDQMKAGDYFGEMSLLTGAARTATIRARCACRLQRIPRSALKEVIEADGDLLSVLSHNLAERNLNRSRKLEAAKEGGELISSENLAQRLLKKMRRVFASKADP